jgi:hypothetical protein
MWDAWKRWDMLAEVQSGNLKKREAIWKIVM